MALLLEDLFDIDLDAAEETRRFTTYQNYISAIAYVCPSASTLQLDLRQRRNTNEYRAIRVVKDLPDRFEQVLRNCWFSEIQFHTASNDADGRLLSLHWSHVIAYYCFYLGLRSYQLVAGQPQAPKHTQTLNAFSNEIEQRGPLIANPWTVRVGGDPKIKVDFHGVPAGFVFGHVNNLSAPSPQSALQYVVLALKTTRERSINDRLDDWKRKNKKARAPASARAAIVEKLAPTNLGHFLYRMRLRSNYEDADSFILSDVSEADAQAMYDNLKTIIDSAAWMFECIRPAGPIIEPSSLSADPRCPPRRSPWPRLSAAARVSARSLLPPSARAT